MRLCKLNRLLLVLTLLNSIGTVCASVNQVPSNAIQSHKKAKYNRFNYKKKESSFGTHNNLQIGTNESDILTHNFADGSPKVALSSDKVILNFENSDIQSTIKAISQLSGKNFVIDPRVKGVVTIVSDKPIAKADSYKVLETALRMQGFAVVEGDGVIKVLPEADAKTYGMQTLPQNGTQAKQIGDQIVTKIFIIQHGSAAQLSNSLRPLIAPNNSISVYTNSNALIVTDYASNINRISKIIDQLNSTNGVKSQATVVQLKYAIAADVFQILQSYLQNGSGTGGGGGNSGDGPAVTITVDAANNSLIIYSMLQDRIDEIRNLALRLDQNTSYSNNNLHVVYLRNADAAHIADVLRVVAYGQENPDITSSSSLAKLANEPSSMFQSSGSGGSGSSAFSSGGSSSTANRPSSATQSRSSSSSGGQNGKDQPKIFIQAEPTTNSLIIQAPDAVYRNLRMIIEMLDVRRAQIMIEAMIADINSVAGGTFGIQWAVGAGNNTVGGLAVGNYAGNGNSLYSIATTAYGLTQAASGSGTTTSTTASLPNEMYVGLVTGTVSIGGQTVPTLGALADMLSSNSSVNILSRPTLITLDNEEAKIMVGSNVPVPNGSYQNTASSNTITNTYTRQDVGTFLDVRPLITQSGAIQMDIYQEDSQIDSSTLNNSSGPSFLKRNMRTTLLVDDGQIIAIGGMTSDNVTIQKNGIPLLSDIPYLGWLFSWQSRSHTKQNLVLFLRPVIIRNIEGYKALTNNRYQYVLDQQNMIKASGNLVLPTIKPVTLDNQVPFAKENIPPQPDTSQVNTPIVDMRASAINNNQQSSTVKPEIVPRAGVENNSNTVIYPAN